MATEVASLFAKLGLVPDEQQWAHGDQLISGLKKAAIGLAAAFGVNQIREWISETVNAGTEALHTSEKLGISVESVGELGYAARKSGIDMETLTTAVGKLSHGVGDQLAAGKGPMLDVLNSIGISSTELKTKLSGKGGVDDILGELADKFAGMEEGGEKMRLSIDLFGRSGMQLIPFLNKGSAGIADLRREAHELGVTFDDTSAKQMASVKSDYVDIKEGLSGVRNELVIALAPVLKQATEYIVAGLKSVVAWIQNHKEEIQAFFYALGQTLVFIGHAIWMAIQVVVGVFQLLYEIIVDIGTIALEVGKVIYEGLLKPIGEFGLWLWNTITKVLASIVQAFSWVGDKVSAFFSAVYDLGKRIVDFFVEVGQGIRDAFESAFDYVANLPIVKQIRQIIDEWKDIHGDTATDNYQTYIQNQSNSDVGGRGLPGATLSREEFEKQYRDNVAAQAAARAGGGPGAGQAAVGAPSYSTNSGGTTNVVNLGGVTVTAPVGADAAQLGALVHQHAKVAVQDALDQTIAHGNATVQGVPGRK